jgi:hypothetical protein
LPPPLMLSKSTHLKIDALKARKELRACYNNCLHSHHRRITE